MRRHPTQPFDARIAHGSVGVQALGDRVTDDGLALLLEQLDELLLLLNQRVNFRGFVVEELGDLGLFVEGGGGAAEWLPTTPGSLWASRPVQIPE